MATSETNGSASDGFLSPNRTLWLVLYNVGLMLLLGAGLFLVISSTADTLYKQEKSAREQARLDASKKIPAAKPAAALPAAPADTTTGNAETSDSAAASAPATDSVQTQSDTPETPLTDPHLIAYILFAITMAGGLGGTLCNLRGIFEFTRDNKGKFPEHLEMGFYLRPVSGILCGLFTFFVSTFFAGALSQGGSSGWRTLDGMFPYIGIAFIAGFASQEFMERLKDTARTLFGSGNGNAPAPEPEPEPQPEPEAGAANRESLNPLRPEKGGRESLSGDGDKPVEKRTPPPRNPSPPSKLAD